MESIKLHADANDSQTASEQKRQQAFHQSSRLLDHETFIQQFKKREESDAELIEDYIRNNNNKAFDQLYKRHKTKMLAYLYGILHNWEDAKDVLHDAWEAVLKSFSNHKYCEEQDFACWFKSLCYHKAIDWQRAKHQFFYGSRQLPEDADPSYNAEQRMDNCQSELHLQRAINRLPESERQVVILRIYQNMSFCEIAVIRHITTAAARSIYSKALKKLKKGLD